MLIFILVGIRYMKSYVRGTWVAQSVEHPTLGHDLRVMRLHAASGSVLREESA